jgi:hypothetical protein
MIIYFECSTNGTDVRINTLKIKLKGGSVLTIDRDWTEFNIENGKLTMTWRDCYLWALDGWNIFGEGYRLDYYSIEELKNMIEYGYFEFEIEDSADEDYYVTINKVEVYV